MHFSLPHLIYSGDPVDDEDTLALLPLEVQEALRDRNGCLAYRGAIHIRGASISPGWHSLRHAMVGALAFHELYPGVTPGDVPIAEDLFGDQFILRDGAVLRLEAETGSLDPLADSLEAFLQRVMENLPDLLGYDPLQALTHAWGQLEPGKLLIAYPPFVLDTGTDTRSIRPIDALEARQYLAEFARQLRDIPDGGQLNIRVVE
ncbi:MAG: SMI1/KNR4 family protein [Gemmatimonadota bacterium]